MYFINNRFPSRRFLNALEWFCRAKKRDKRLAFLVARARANTPEEARRLFSRTAHDSVFRAAALKHWEKRSQHLVQHLKDRALNTEWQMWRYLHLLSPAGGEAERLCARYWREHAQIRHWLEKPAGM